LFLLVNRNIDQEVRKRLTKSKNVVTVKKPFFIFKNIGILWYIFQTYYLLKQLAPDYFWAPANVLPPFVPKGIKTVLTVHDLISKKLKNTMMTVDRYYYSMFFDQSVTKADILWAVSYYTKNELLKVYPDRRCKDIIVGQCFEKKLININNFTSAQKEKTAKKYGMNNKFLLFVGTIEPRKNLAFLLSLMPQLAEYGFSLLVVGTKGWGDPKIGTIINSVNFPRQNVVFSGYLSKEQLDQLYIAAALIVLPSLNEGFGLPAFEAMSCGCPVVAADNSGLREVVQDGGLLIKGWNTEDWINGIITVYNDRDKFKKMAISKYRKLNATSTIEKVLKKLQTKNNR